MKQRIRTLKVCCLIAVYAGLSSSASANSLVLPPIQPKNPEKVVHIEPPRAPTALHFAGNLAIADAALLEVAAVEYGARPSAEQMPQLIKALYSFYHKAGYDLVRMEYTATEQGWVVYIEEGVLSEIRIFGLGWYDTILLHNALLPNGIYNRKQLEEQLSDWAQRPDIASISYEMVRSPRASDVSSNDFIAEISRMLRTHRGVHALDRKWGTQLRIYCKHTDNYSSISPGFGYSSENGFELDATYHKGSFIRKRDHLSIYGLVGLNTLETIDPGNNEDHTYFNFHNRIKWRTPSPGTDKMRFYFSSNTALTHQQRPDLPIDLFRLLRVEETLNLSRQFGSKAALHASLGYEYQLVFDTTMVAATPFTIVDGQTHALQLATGMAFLFGKPQDHKEFNHTLSLDFSHRFRLGGDQIDLLQAKHNYAFGFRFLDIVNRMTGTMLLGDTRFFDEFPLQSLGMRTSFNQQFSVRKSFNISTDLRYNLVERKLQAGPFQDVAVFGKIDPATQDDELTVAYAAGPAIYLELWSAFRLHCNFAFGVTSNSDTSFGFNLGLTKLAH